MRIYTALTDEQIERVLRTDPVSREQVQTIQTDEGAFEVRNKIHKVCVHDLASETHVVDGREYRTDPSIRSLQERWQIPMPHVATTRTVSSFLVLPDVLLVVEQDKTTKYYFVADSYLRVASFA